MKKDTEESYQLNNVVTFSKTDLDEHFKDDLIKATDKSFVLKEKNRVLAKRTAVFNFIKQSELYKDYDSIVVPDEFIQDCKEIEEQELEKSKYSNLTAAERREIEKRMVAYTLRWDHLKEDNLTLEKIEGS